MLHYFVLDTFVLEGGAHRLHHHRVIDFSVIPLLVSSWALVGLLLAVGATLMIKRGSCLMDHDPLEVSPLDLGGPLRAISHRLDSIFPLLTLRERGQQLVLLVAKDN